MAVQQHEIHIPPTSDLGQDVARHRWNVGAQLEEPVSHIKDLEILDSHSLKILFDVTVETTSKLASCGH